MHTQDTSYVLQVYASETPRGIGVPIRRRPVYVNMQTERSRWSMEAAALDYCYVEGQGKRTDPEQRDHRDGQVGQILLVCLFVRFFPKHVA